jgi:hypothetical protein
MIQFPKRSVTRFFVPLIDVLTLLFCIFLLMPMVKPSSEAAGINQLASLEVQLLATQEELEKQRKEGGATEDLQKELKRLRDEKIKTLQQRLQVRVLEIDPATGKLYYNAPERLEIRSEADARELIEKDQRSQGSDRRELYYLVLFPRDPASPYPLRGQREQYDRWFAEVAHGWDIPGAARGGTP